MQEKEKSVARQWKLFAVALIFVIFVLSTALLSACARRKGLVEPDVRLFVPCGMIEAFRAVETAFEKETSKEVDILFDNAVVLVRKIRKGERPDILITPGELEMKMMVEEGYIDKKTVRAFGTFEMVLVVPKQNRAKVRSVKDLSKPSVRAIAIAEPTQNSAGYYAKKALENLGEWEKVKHKIVDHWHALEAVAYVCKGRVDAGIYYATCPFDSGPEKLEEVGIHEQRPYRIVEVIPRNVYPPVQVQAGILKEGKHQKVAAEFTDFLLKPQTQKLLAEKGIPNFPRSRLGQ